MNIKICGKLVIFWTNFRNFQGANAHIEEVVETPTTKHVSTSPLEEFSENELSRPFQTETFATESV